MLNIPVADNYNLKTLEIVYPDGTKSIDLRFVYQTLDIYEDIFANSISGKIGIFDSNNLISNGPLLGFEQIKIEFETPDKLPFQGTFQIYNISNRIPEKERSSSYYIEFCSPEQFANFQTSSGKSYKGMLISDIAADIQKMNLFSSFNLLETTKYLHDIIIPVYWDAFDALNWLTTRANSAQYNGANYLYFQNKNGYNFVSMEKLLDTKDPAANYFYGPLNIRIPSTTHATKDTVTDFVNIKDYIIPKQVNLLDNMASGMYASRFQSFDFLNKTFSYQDFNYSDNYSKIKHLENNIKYNSLTQSSGSSKLVPDFLQKKIQANSVNRFFPDSSSYDFPNRSNEWLSKRLSQLQELQNNKLKIVVPGDSERTIGEVVNVLLPSPEPIDKEQILDNYFQGRYLISSLKHSITQEKYITTMELCKDSFYSSLPY